MTAEQECVSNILSKKLGPGEKPTDQDLAIAFSECRDKQASYAIQNLTIKLANMKIANLKPRVRYLTASLNSEFIPEPEKQGHFASYFLLAGDQINGREWGVTSESIPQNIMSFVGKPLVATGDKFIKDSPYGVNFLHPSITHFVNRAPELVAGLNPMNMDHILQFQDQFKIGTIEDVFFDTERNVWNAVVHLAQGVEASDLPPFCSPALYQLDMAEHEGSLTQWTGLHLAALTEKPAYGNIALLNGTCSGTTGQCKTTFAGNNNVFKSEIMKIAAQLSTDSRETDVVCLPNQPCKKEARKKGKRNY